MPPTMRPPPRACTVTPQIFLWCTQDIFPAHHRGGEELGGELPGGGGGHGGQAEDEEDSHAVSSGQHENIIINNNSVIIVKAHLTVGQDWAGGGSWLHL